MAIVVPIRAIEWLSGPVSGAAFLWPALVWKITISRGHEE
jgi:hypothetical protein